MNELPKTLKTYSSYYETLTAIAYLSKNEDFELKLSTLASYLGKNKTSVSEQLKGHLSEHDLVNIERKASKLLSSVNLHGVAYLWIKRLEERYELYRDLPQHLNAPTLSSEMLDNLNNMEQNPILIDAVSASLQVYGRSVTEVKGKNRGYLANNLDWSLADFLDFMDHSMVEIETFVHPSDYPEEDFMRFGDISDYGLKLHDNPSQKVFKDQIVELFKNI